MICFLNRDLIKGFDYLISKMLCNSWCKNVIIYLVNIFHAEGQGVYGKY